MEIWYGISSFVLGLILFFPTRKIISAIAVNRLQNKENREVTADEADKIKKRASLYAAVIAFTFAFLYNKFVMFKYFSGVN